MEESNIKQSIDKLITGNDMLHVPSKQMRKLLKDMVDSDGSSGGSGLTTMSIAVKNTDEMSGGEHFINSSTR